MDTTIAFIGAGNMARSLIGGLLAAGHDAARIWAADPTDAALAALRERFGVNVCADNAAAVGQADVVVFAVKPQQLRPVASALAIPVNNRRPLLLSIAAGIRVADLSRWLGAGRTSPAAPEQPLPLVRCMPNTPALLRCGATALYADRHVSAAQRATAEAVLATAGTTIWVDDERLLDAVTALSGSGPAYFFLVMEALERAGVELGLSAEQARALTLQTALGAARMAQASTDPPATLRAQVTSPGGTTERAVAILQAGDLEALFGKALAGARQRCVELSNELGNSELRGED